MILLTIISDIYNSISTYLSTLMMELQPPANETCRRAALYASDIVEYRLPWIFMFKPGEWCWDPFRDSQILQTLYFDFELVYLIVAKVYLHPIVKGTTLLTLFDGAVFSTDLFYLRYLTLFLWAFFFPLLKRI